MSRKVYVNVTARIIMDMDEGVDVCDVISNMDHSFTSPTGACDFIDTEIIDYEITDCK